MIIGTAGHIDHGKSALVAALTGRPMDRLAEEKRRGITIDLNFAPLDLGEDGIAGVVDVPGHEDFVRTMVAGASGVDLALLVVAADEGIMPQTLEHLAVLEHLGVRAGIPVLAKADLVDRDWLELVAAELGERLAGSPVAFGPPVAVSAKTGEGIDASPAADRGARPRAGARAARRPVPTPGGSGILGGGCGHGGDGHDVVGADRGGGRCRVASCSVSGAGCARSRCTGTRSIAASRDGVRRWDWRASPVRT